VLERERKNPMTFATMCLAWIEPRFGEVTILNLGHPSPLLVHTDGSVSQIPAIPMPPLGTVDWPVEEPLTVSLPEGWRLLFYTDGLLEGRASPGSRERFGEQRLIDAVCRHVTGSVGEDDLDRLIREVEAAGGACFDDDVTVMLVSAVGARAAADGATRASVSSLTTAG
jgi:serine phosphatase RsbU (regulator of sigma subunit)